MRFSSLILKNLTRRPSRSGLTLIALATAITAVISLFGIAQGFTRAFSDVYSAHGVDIVVSRQGTADRLSSSVDAQFVSRVEQLPGVHRAAGVMLDTLSLEQQAIYGIPTMGIATNSWLLESYDITQGSLFRPQRVPESEPIDQTASRSVLLGTHLAERIGKKAGDSIVLFEESYYVAGVFQSTSSWENGSMILPLGTLQELTDRPGQVTYINVILDRHSNLSSGVSTGDSISPADKVIESIQAIDRRLLPLTTSEYVQTDTRMQIANAMAWMTSAIALLIGSIGTLNTMLTSVLERTKEIGILRAIGWSRRRVVGMILGESCGLAIVASILGGLFAVLLTKLLSQSPAARGLITPHIDTKAILQGLVLAIVIGLLGAALPALRAARLSPTEAFREH